MFIRSCNQAFFVYTSTEKESESVYAKLLYEVFVQASSVISGKFEEGAIPDFARDTWKRAESVYWAARGDDGMPTLLRKDGFKFFFYANEHEPKHIHVSKAEDYAKVELSTFRVIHKFMKPNDVKKALRIIQENNDAFEAKWDDWFRQRQNRSLR